jgi:hypothetical protein
MLGHLRWPSIVSGNRQVRLSLGNDTVFQKEPPEIKIFGVDLTKFRLIKGKADLGLPAQLRGELGHQLAEQRGGQWPGPPCMKVPSNC